jgi:hypothetical protein
VTAYRPRARRSTAALGGGDPLANTLHLVVIFIVKNRGAHELALEL